MNHSDTTNGRANPVDQDKALPSREVTLAELVRTVESHFSKKIEDAPLASIITDILDELPIAVFIKDAECRHVFVNKANEDLFQRPRADVLNKTDRDLFPNELSRQLMKVDGQVISTGETIKDTETIKSKDGRELIIDTVRTRLEDAKGRRWLLGITKDMTDIKRRERDLEQAKQLAEAAERSKSEFLANMSHEIRTPMNGIMGMAELLQETEMDSKQKMFANVIAKSGAALLVVINDILDFSKITAGQLELMNESFNLAEAIEDVATLVSSRAAEKDIELVVRFDHEMPKMLIGDAGRIRQVLTNMVGNAVKFTDVGHVCVHVNGATEVETNQCKLSVRIEDTGTGIPDDNLASVFDKFSQVDASATRRHEGTGLGLSISKSLIELMGGQVGAESEEGKGSTFWFEISLPISDEDHNDIKVPADVTGARIAVIDDNIVNRCILSEQLEAWKFEHAELESGELGLYFLRKAAEHGLLPDLLILDYQMPNMNGQQVLEEIRTDDVLRNLPVLVLTSVDTGSIGHELARLGISASLPKPARSSLLLETIIDVVSRARSGRDVNMKVMNEPKAKSPRMQALTNTANAKAGNVLPNLETAQSVPSESAELDILVAEDNSVNQILMSNILDEMGYSYEIVENGKLAVEAVKQKKPRLILMDISMPEMNGMEATGVIREYEAKAECSTPIIGVTAHALKGDQEKCIAAGMDDYVSKPVSVAELKNKLESYLGRKSADESTAA
ncbi:MAG: response regulator [Pseudomonadota bacterium]